MRLLREMCNKPMLQTDHETVSLSCSKYEGQVFEQTDVKLIG